MNKLAYTNEYGGVSIVVPALKKDIEKVLGPLSDAAYEAHVRERSVPAGVIAYEVTDANLPNTREFRDAWIINNKVIEHDLEKAKAIQLFRIRAARQPKLQELDVKYSIALESGDKELMTAIVQQKQALRDITEPLKNAQLSTIDDVKKFSPKE